MLDIKFLRENKDLVKENLKKKFQDEKLPLVDEASEKYDRKRELQLQVDNLRKERNSTSSEIGILMKEQKKEEAEEKKKRVVEINATVSDLENEMTTLGEEIEKIMMIIPQMIDSSVPIGKDDSENVEIERFGEPVVPNYEIPYHADICEALGGLDKEAAGRTTGNGFYYLMGDIARLHEAMIAYARDFMIDKGFTYCIPPFMIRSDVVTGVMSFAEMDAMMYKIENEDLYLIGTSEHSMIGKFKGQLIKEENRRERFI